MVPSILLTQSRLSNGEKHLIFVIFNFFTQYGAKYGRNGVLRQTTYKNGPKNDFIEKIRKPLEIWFNEHIVPEQTKSDQPTCWPACAFFKPGKWAKNWNFSYTQSFLICTVQPVLAIFPGGARFLYCKLGTFGQLSLYKRRFLARSGLVPTLAMGQNWKLCEPILLLGYNKF